MKKLTIFLLSLIVFTSVRADEGMWMLPLIEKLNIKKMNGMGCTLTAEEIYSDKNASLKDAVVVFGRGCTGVMVSPNGLLFTNHHCGYDAIQQLSAVDHNYLKDGFTAKELKDELRCKGLTVKFLKKVEDITPQVLPSLVNVSEQKRRQVADSITTAIGQATIKGTKYFFNIVPMYGGNQYYLFVYERFNDVRLAYTPPSSIGKFGGETDNWMYPRHTGDFSVFRVYADSVGKPADYSPKNIPYTPVRYANISNQGYNEGDFAMILGNPGSTDRYLTSWGIYNEMNAANKARIEIRGAKQDVWLKYMRANEAINIAYASKYAMSSNYWKNSMGMNKAIDRLNVIEHKEKLQAEFTEWVNKTPERKEKYGQTLENLKRGYELIYPFMKPSVYLSEAFKNGVELPSLAYQANSFVKRDPTDPQYPRLLSYYKDYYSEVDKATLIALLEAYKKSVDADALPEFYQTIDKKYKGNYERFAEDLFKKSAFTSLEKFTSAVKKGKDLEKDPALLFYKEIANTENAIKNKEYTDAKKMIEINERAYQAGLLEMAAEQNKPMYPDANFTMRLTYGQIKGYEPADATTYRYYTTTQGILEKENNNDPEFVVPEILKQNIVKENFGNYIDKKTNSMHVAYTTTNDITGGNSGSPVFNGKGEVIGLAFDGNWESLSGDIIFEPNLQRCITVDIRYVLFVMEKVGGADRLIKELTIK